jgi:excisionase family DNA binding protein
MAKEVMTLHEAAEYLSISDETLRRFAFEGAIPAFKLGRDWRFSLARLQEWMTAKETGRNP